METDSYWNRERRCAFFCLFGALILGALGSIIGSRTVVPGPWSLDALLRNPGERAALQGGIPPREVVVLLLSRSDNRAFSDVGSDVAVRELIEGLRSLKRTDTGERFFNRILTKGHTLLADAEPQFLSSDNSTLLIRAETGVPVYEAARSAAVWRSEIEKFERRRPDFMVRTLSYGGGDKEIFDLIHYDLDRSLVFTLPITGLILWWVFGSVLTALVPLFLAIVGLVASLGAAAIISRLIEPISATAHQLVVLLVLAVGVDYALFFISRVRDECKGGKDYLEAIRRARETTGRAIVWSGVTVALSLVGLFFVRDTVLESMAIVSIVAIIIVVILTMYALPFILKSMGRERVLPRRGGDGDSGASSMAIVSRCALQRPRLALLLSVVPLIALASYAFSVRFGSVMERHLLPARMQTAQAFETLRRSFPQLSGTSFTLIMRGIGVEELEEAGELQFALERIKMLPGVSGPISTEFSSDNTILRYTFLVEGTANDYINRAHIETIRKEIIPAELQSRGLSGWVSGSLAYVSDETARYLARTPLVIGGVLCVSAVLLLFVFRSALIPLKAVALNLLSCGAAFGAVALTFQTSLLPGWNLGVVEGFVPALLFAILFGLSMDYHVLLIARTREGVLEGLDTAAAVERAVHATGRSITGAAAIMASVFLVVSTLELPVMRQLGVGLAVGVVIDATIIRAVLVPAAMVLLGRWNWYLPRWAVVREASRKE